jgi:hypothetical protein
MSNQIRQYWAHFRLHRQLHVFDNQIEMTAQVCKTVAVWTASEDCFLIRPDIGQFDVQHKSW